MIGEFILAGLAFSGTLSAALAAYFWYQGNSAITFDTDAAQETSIIADHQAREISCRCLLPLTNRGRQQGMVLNVFCMPMHYGRIMDQLDVQARLRLLREPLRANAYWEAIIVQKEAAYLTELEVTIRSQLALDAVIREIPWLTILIYYQVVDRRDLKWRLSEIRFHLKQLSEGQGDGLR